MFGRRYFGARYFGPAYWGDGGTLPPPPPPPVEVPGGGEGGKRRRLPRRWTDEKRRKIVEGMRRAYLEASAPSAPDAVRARAAELTQGYGAAADMRPLPAAAIGWDALLGEDPDRALEILELRARARRSFALSPEEIEVIALIVDEM